QHERHHGIAVVSRARDRFQSYEPHPDWSTPGGWIEFLVWPQCRISNDAVEVEQQVARVNALGWDCPLDGRMEHPKHIPEPAFQTLAWRQVRLLIYWPHVAMERGSGHCKRPLHKLAAHLAHWSLLAIDQNAVLDCLLAAVNTDHLNSVVANAPGPVFAVYGSARCTNAIACM